MCCFILFTTLSLYLMQSIWHSTGKGQHITCLSFNRLTCFWFTVLGTADGSSVFLSGRFLRSYRHGTVDCCDCLQNAETVRIRSAYGVSLNLKWNNYTCKQHSLSSCTNLLSCDVCLFLKVWSKTPSTAPNYSWDDFCFISYKSPE